MTNINCTATNCSHNKETICHANIINIVGVNSEKDCDTACSSFLDKDHYGNLSNNIFSEGNPCDALVCKVNTCKYNDNKACNLDSINVSGKSVKIYEQTSCESFCK
ncbi:DUF1540 domain-containing protein [Clostridium sp.]|uniref:DUF1540 domain-containing protein n=1 Tax=Clostridium sp. TaxID=1506 RepID=UPI00260FE6BE|nr:DUF1540 domain-containing protein [Clostridium sp.]